MRKDNRLSYIYGLKDPRDEQIHYIGKSNAPRIRLRQHLDCKGSNVARIAWLTELSSAGLEPELVILQRVPLSEWQQAEVYWIARGREEGWPLVNISDGGTGTGIAIQPDFDFMRSYVAPDLWDQFDSLSIRQKDDICLKVASAMANSHRAFLRRKIETQQYVMHSIIDDELVFIGMKTAMAYLVHKWAGQETQQR